MTVPTSVRIEGLHKSLRFARGPARASTWPCAEHEVVCLIGASGSGKSTLLRCINLLEPIDAGRILIDGSRHQPGRDVDENQVRRGIGIVFQAFNLFPHMSVLDNVTLGPRRVLRLPRAEAETQATELLARFGLADKRDEYPDRLSGGQQQRVAIVRALAMQPELMLLDEITSALDPELVAEVLNVVRELAAGGMTMIIATHEMGFARDIANRVCFLDRGAILEEGPPAQIFRAPRGADPPVPPAGDRGRPAVGVTAAGWRQAATNASHSRSNSAGVDSVRSGWHWTATKNGSSSAVSRPSTSGPMELSPKAEARSPGARSAGRTAWWW